MERDVHARAFLHRLSYFNSHAHVERDAAVVASILVRSTISTHTLTWSVTEATLENYDAKFISTHTLTWSVTHKVE